MINQSCKVTDIIPIYDHSNVAGGYFEIYFDYTDTDPFKLSFVPFLDHKVRNDASLYEFIKNKDSENYTVSDAIYELYDIGVPVDTWVEEYIEMVKERVDARLFNALVQLFTHIKGFNSGSADNQ